MFAWALELGERVAGWWKARQQQKALSDLQRGQDILRQMEADGAVITERVDAEMRASADAMEARKRLTTDVAGVPVIPPPAAPAAEVSPHGGAQPLAPPAAEVPLHGAAEPPTTVEKPE